MTEMEGNELRLTPKELFIADYIWPEASNHLVIEAFRNVDRLPFIPLDRQSSVYTDDVTQLAEGSSISQPSLVARMMDHLGLSGRGKVLEVGTASGYGAALLSCCTSEVFTIEYNPELAQQAEERLRLLGYQNIQVRCSDGVLGWPEEVPFDAIIVTAGARAIPMTLIKQLAEKGRMVIPVGTHLHQLQLTVVQKETWGLLAKPAGFVNFHPLMSPYPGGWTEEMLREIREETEATGRQRLQALQEAVSSLGIAEEDLPTTDL